MSLDLLNTVAAPSPFVDPAIGGREDALISLLLTEQGDLSAVERFTQIHEDEERAPRGRSYAALLPATPPGPGQQLAFEVDLDRCSGCKACVAACHSLNGLDEGESWREVGLLIGGPAPLPVLQHVTSSCHHCLEPACLSACPAEAYEKDANTGIVRHLDDQCIGCQYCTLACPYDAPKFHAGKGIVRKCDMCADRLRVGEAPACVQACPHEAIRIRVVDRAEILKRAEAGEFLPSVADPKHTRPTTLYRTLRPLSIGVEAGDAHDLKPDHAHPPLVAMLVLTQMAVGGFLVELCARVVNGAGVVESGLHVLLCLAVGLAGLAASLLHLGRPLLAYRALLGWRHSWLSREVLALGAFAKLATAFVVVRMLGPSRLNLPDLAETALLAATVAIGLVGVGCSVMVYHAVRRPFWHARIAGVKFAGTTALLGLSTAMASRGLSGSSTATAGEGPPMAALLAGAMILLSALKPRREITATRGGSGSGGEGETLRRSGELLRGPLRRLAALRRVLGVLGGIAMPALVMVGAITGRPSGVALASLAALVLSIGGELTERALFFKAVARPKMPGGAA